MTPRRRIGDDACAEQMSSEVCEGRGSPSSQFALRRPEHWGQGSERPTHLHSRFRLEIAVERIDMAKKEALRGEG
jgi:hypothetical protein